MKYKFHEHPPSFVKPDDFWEVDYPDRNLYLKEICWIAKNMGLEMALFRVEDMTFGDPVLFYNGKYFGYLDSYFYRCFDLDTFDDWWGFDN